MEMERKSGGPFQADSQFWPGIKSKAKESSLDTWAAAAAASDASMREKWHAQYPRN